MTSRALDTQFYCTHLRSTKQWYLKTSSVEGNQYTHCHMQQQQHAGLTQDCTICESGRRGGVAARGSGSCSTSTSEREIKAPPRLSLVIYNFENDEDSDSDLDPVSPPLSPKTLTVFSKPRSRYRAATMQQSASMKRRSGWKPSLKEELLRRTSTDSAMGQGQIELWKSYPADFCTETIRRGSTTGESLKIPQLQRRRGSTLLHPSPPVMSVENHVSTMNIRPISPLSGRKERFPTRKGSSLLHPSPPLSDTETGLERGIRNMQLKTVMSVPPRKHWR